MALELEVMGSLVCATSKGPARTRPRRCLIIAWTPRALQQCASQLVYCSRHPSTRKQKAVADHCSTSSSDRPLIPGATASRSRGRSVISGDTTRRVTSSPWVAVRHSEFLGLEHPSDGEFLSRQRLVHSSPFWLGCNACSLRWIFSFQRACSIGHGHSVGAEHAVTLQGAGAYLSQVLSGR